MACHACRVARVALHPSHSMSAALRYDVGSGRRGGNVIWSIFRCVQERSRDWVTCIEVCSRDRLSLARRRTVSVSTVQFTEESCCKVGHCVIEVIWEKGLCNRSSIGCYCDVISAATIEGESRVVCFYNWASVRYHSGRLVGNRSDEALCFWRLPNSSTHWVRCCLSETNGCLSCLCSLSPDHLLKTRYYHRIKFMNSITFKIVYWIISFIELSEEFPPR